MNLTSGLKRVACGGILLSCAFLFHGSGVVVQVDATSAVSEMQRTLDVNQTQSDDHATVAPSQVDDDDDDDERGFGVLESVSKASTNAMKAIKSNVMVQKKLSMDAKLARTKTLFDKYKLQMNDPRKFFSDSNFFKWRQKTKELYEPDEKKAYAAMFSTVLSRSNGDEEAVTKLIMNRWNFGTDHWIDAQVNHWKALDLDTKKVYDLLKLRKEGHNVLNSPKLSSWVKFAEAKNENPAERLWELLTGVGNGAKMPRIYEAYFLAVLGRVLQTPRETPYAKLFGPFLEKKLLARWKQQNYPIADALRDMGIDSPDLDVWLAYIRTMGDKDHYTIFSTAGKLRSNAVAGAVGLALQSNDQAMKLSKNMLRAQNKLWSKGGITPERLFGDLKLQDAGDNLFASPLWRVWTSYLNFKGKEDAKNLMMMTLRKYYEKEKLLGIVTKAKEVPETESIASFVGARLSRE